MPPSQKFQVALVYSTDPEDLRSRSVRFAIQKHLKVLMTEDPEEKCDSDATYPELLETYAWLGVRVGAFAPIKPLNSWVDAQVEKFIGGFEESFNAEYCAEGMAATPWTEQSRTWIKRVMLANVTKSLRGAVTQIYEEIDFYSFSKDECLQILSRDS